MHDVMQSTNRSLLLTAERFGDIWGYIFDLSKAYRKDLPHYYLMEPVYSSIDDFNKEVVGFLLGLTDWKTLFDRVVPPGAPNGLILVVSNDCGYTMTFELDGPEVTYLGPEDLHDHEFDSYEKFTNIEINDNATDGLCLHELRIYPSSHFRDAYYTNSPVVYTGIVVAAFVLTALIVVLYNVLVNRRQKKTMASAARGDELIASLFPEKIHKRLMEEHGDVTASGRTGGEESSEMEATRFRTKQIAEFYPEVTLMFADISGFTSWSSMREPFAVFTLLETVYGAMDEIAQKRQIFKVETVGDCYVAAVGVPTPRKDHAVAMARFAKDCLLKMNKLVKQLEVTLGPDTADLSFRIGLHSGPVTGGVLRGKNARFQLFGDSMNVCSRIETLGKPGMIHLSMDTADLLIQAGKGHWLTPRIDEVVAKGKGKMKTMFLKLSTDIASSFSGGSQHSKDLSTSSFDECDHHHKYNNCSPSDKILSTKEERLVEWNTRAMLDRLEALSKARGDNEAIPPVVVTELTNFVAGIAFMYQSENPFHNWEHASHVTMSVIKLMARVEGHCHSEKHEVYMETLIDPMTLLALVFSAIVHDVDHTGVPNAQLVQEGAPVTALYNQSPAENNSIAVAWNFLEQPEFANLRTFISPDAEGLDKLRSLIVSMVLATDVADKDLKAQRNARWENVFSEAKALKSNDTGKSTIVLEHLIQASDVSHTMQHWQVYRKWNELFFMECYKAYKNGRSPVSPADNWYSGEMGFFDFYIIPLAKKLKECGVFGVSSAEYLDYAEKNRKEWEDRGQEIVSSMLEKAEAELG